MRIDGLVPAKSTEPWPTAACEQQRALLDTWHEDARFRALDAVTLRAAAALGPAEQNEPRPLLTVACDAPTDAWTMVRSLAEDQARIEKLAEKPEISEEVTPEIEVPPEPEHALRHA